MRFSIVAAMKGSGDSAVSRLIRVRGRVQGVFFRASTQSRARELGISGHARNLPDGSVEVVAHGAPDVMDVFVKWLWTGSPASKVTAVESEPFEHGTTQRPADFTTG